MAMLEESMRSNGFFDGMTAAADGEIIDGSARIEKSALLFADEAIVVEHDGTRPIVEVRTDIPDASDPRAKQIALVANRIAQVNLKFDPQVLKGLSDEIDLKPLWTPDELQQAVTVKTEILLPPDESLLNSSSPSHAPLSDQARHPLSITLTNVQKREWDEYKERVGVSSDTAAFVVLFKENREC